MLVEIVVSTNGFITLRAVHFHRGSEVSIDYIQKKVSWIVMRLTGITWKTHHKCFNT